MHKVVYGAAIICGEISIKEMNSDVTVPKGDQNLRIIMGNLKLKDNQYHLVRWRIDQLIDEDASVSQADGA